MMAFRFFQHKAVRIPNTSAYSVMHHASCQLLGEGESVGGRGSAKATNWKTLLKLRVSGRGRDEKSLRVFDKGGLCLARNKGGGAVKGTAEGWENHTSKRNSQGITACQCVG